MPTRSKAAPKTARTKRAVVYTRISQDVTGEGLGVRRQEKECRGLADRLGLEVARVYSDNDISAYSGKARPGYEAMLADIRAGYIDVVLAWHTDRLYRRMDALVEYIGVCEAAGVVTHTVQSGELDLTTPSGRMIAQQLGSVAEYEVRQKGARQRAAQEQRARRGKYWSSVRPFGYEKDGVTVKEDEAAAIRKAYQTILNGGTFASIAREWNEAQLWSSAPKRKLPPEIQAQWEKDLERWEEEVERARAEGTTEPPRPAKPFVHAMWRGENVRNLMASRRYIGQVVYRREQLLDDDGEPVRAEWPAIVDEPTWKAVQEIMATNHDRHHYPSAKRQLLSGIGQCGVCGLPLQSAGQMNGRRRYRCGSIQNHPNRESAPIDSYVERAVVARLQQPDVRRALTPKPDQAKLERVLEQVATLKARQEEMAEAFMDGTVSREQLQAANRRAEIRRQELEAQLPPPSNPALEELITTDDVAMTWSKLNQDAKRAAIQILCTVEILPAYTKENAYLDWQARIVNPDTIRITWRP